MSKVALIIIYNHQYNKNIEILEKIYKDRFGNIYHLVPFYSGNKKNVIAVYDSSYYFHGYVAQGYKSYFNENYDHYFFIGDDLILNPVINEKNYREHLKLKTNTCFIPRLSSLSENPAYWNVNLDTLIWELESPGVESRSLFPNHQEALQLLGKFGVVNKPMKFEQIWKSPTTFKEWPSKIFGEKFYLLRRLKYKITHKEYYSFYPLVRSYSDIFVVSADAIKMFCHYCGLFAAARLFVELGLPTSMVFSANEINTEKDLELKGRALWTKEDFKVLDQYENKLSKLFNDFPKDQLYIHPVKLSKWNADL
jgi:hypothetical protein